MKRFRVPSGFQIKYLAAMCIPCILLITFSSFNTSHQPFNDSEKQNISVIQNWYRLYLSFESKDSCAHPPIAARRISELGLAGLFTYAQNRDTYPYNFKRTGLFLNEVYAMLLARMFMNNQVEQKQIRALRNKHRKDLESTSKDIEEFLCLADEIIEKLHHSGPVYNTPKSVHEADQKVNNSVYPSSDRKNILPTWKYQPVYLYENSTLKINSPPNPKNGNAPFLEEALAVFYTSQQLTGEQKWIADFWGDDVRGLTYTPPDRWISIALQLIDQYPLDLESVIELMAKLGIGLNDAVTLCWKYKYLYEVPRPQILIHKYIDSLWQPYHENPSFPSYPSGHAVIGSTASTILITYFGDDIPFTDRSHEGRIEFMGQPRHYSSITAMEKENAWSRVYMGVHYPMDCTEGMQMGRKIGAQLINLELNKFAENSLHIFRAQSYCATATE